MPERITKTVTFPTWAIWNFMFPERDVMQVVAIRYYDAQGQLQTLDPSFYRLTIGRTGVSNLVMFHKNQLPPLEAGRTTGDAVILEYEP